MFLRFTKVKRGSALLEYASIAERIIEDNKQKTRTVKYLGRVRSEADRGRYKKALEDYREAMKKFSLNDMTIAPTLCFGVFYAARSLMEKNDIFNILKRHVKYYAEILSFMIISRLFEPSSDISLIDLKERIYYPWGLQISEDNVYRSLDSLLEGKDEIEMDIFRALKPDTSVVHYDLTSSYFEGREDNDLVMFGYSRDRKRGKEQIVIGLVMADGIPIHHEVWPGNTIDPKTLESTIDVLKDRFHVRNTIFIADRAFGRSKSLDLLDQNQYITAAYRWDQPYRNILMNTDFTDGLVMDDMIIKRVTISVDEVMKDDATEEQRKLAGKRRYIAVYNKEREELDLEDIDRKINEVRRRISEITDQREVRKSLGKLRSLVKFTKNGPLLNERRISILRGIAGRFLIVTNTDLMEDDAVSAYKEQWQIERSFRTMKSFLEIRPVYHRKADRIRAHVFVCVLSLLLSRIMEKMTGMSMSVIKRELNYLDVVPITVENKQLFISSKSSAAFVILEKLGLPYPRIGESAHT